MKKTLHSVCLFTLFCVAFVFGSVEGQSSTQGFDLGELLRHYGSDKDVNGYTSVYHTLFDPIKEKPLNVLEIGIGTMISSAPSSMVGFSQPGYKPGGSLRAWRDYFINGTIFGVDVQPDTQFQDEPRIRTYLCDSTDQVKVGEFMKNIGQSQFDIIIDDGSHVAEHQLKTLCNFYPYLKNGGIYVIEDIPPNSSVAVNPTETAKQCNGDPLFFVGVKNNICVIYKKPLKRDNRPYIY